MKITGLQRMGIEHIESEVADAWLRLINILRYKPDNESDAESYGEKYKFALKAIERVLNHLKYFINNEFDWEVRWALDLETCSPSQSVGLARVYLIDKEGGVFYKPASTEEDLPVRIGHDDEVTLAMAKDLNAAIITIQSKGLREDSDDTLMALTQFLAVNDYLCTRYGEDESGIIVYQSDLKWEQFGVRVYAPIGSQVVFRT